MADDAKCPECDHRWRAHDGRKYSVVCRGAEFHKCPCQQVDPAVQAQDDLAGAAWRNFTGRG